MTSQHYAALFTKLCWLMGCFFPLFAGISPQDAAPATAPVAAPAGVITSLGMGTVMGLVAPLVLESSDWRSVLTLVNESKIPVHAKIVLSTPNQMMTSAPVQTVILAGHSSQRLAVASWLDAGAPDFIGSLTVNIQEQEAAKNMAVAAQMTLIGQGQLAGASIDEELEMPMMGSNFKAVVDDSATLVAVHNSSMESAMATVTCIANKTAKQSAIQIPAGGLRLLHGCELLDSNVVSVATVADLVESDPATRDAQPPVATPAAYQVSAGVSGLSVFGLAISFEHPHWRVSPAMFVNQSDFASQSTVFAGIPVGLYDPLPGTDFIPRLTLANLTNTQRTVVVKGAVSNETGAPKLLATLKLDALEVKGLEVPLNSSVSSSLESLIVEEDGAPGDVISALSDRDRTDRSAFVPLPKFLHHANNGGGHPWSVEPGTSSTIVIFNASDKAQLLNFNLGSDGIAWKKTVTIQPNETLSMDVKEIIQQANEAFPKPNKQITSLTGEISWFTPDQADVFGRVLIAREQDPGRSALESYSCGYNIVLCSMSMNNPFVAINSLATGFLGPVAPEFCTSWAPTQCEGTQYGGGSASSYSWQSTNNTTTPISGSASQSNVALYGQAAGYGGANASAHAGSCSASSGGTAQVTGIIVYNNATQLGGSSNTAYVSSSPQMPAISMQLFGGNSAAAVQWSLNVTYYAQDSPPTNSEDTFSGSSTGSAAWAPNWNGLFRGGTATVTATSAGQSYSDTFYIRGQNPTAAAIDAYIGPTTANTPWFWNYMISWESNRTYWQFDPNNLPYWTNVHGFGLSQIDPPVSASDLWNWQTNLTDAKARLYTKMSAAYSFLQNQITQWNTWNAQHPSQQIPAQADDNEGGQCYFTLPWRGAGTHGFDDANWIKAYNGAPQYYLVWNNSGNIPFWQIIPGFNNYVHNVCNAPLL